MPEGDAEPGAQKKPRGAAHARQLRSEGEPVRSPCEPAGHGEHASLPAPLHEPAEHGVGTALPPGHAKPAGHAVPTAVDAAPGAQKVPPAMR